MPSQMHDPVSDKVTPEWVAKPERSNTWAIRVIAWVALALGRRAARLFLHPICIYFFLFSPEARAASKQYLQKALSRQPSVADLLRHYHAFASTVLDRVFFLSGRFDMLDVRIHGMDGEGGILRPGRGCILLGAHLGSFEVIRAFGRKINGPAASMVMYEDNARKLNSVLRALNPDLAKQVIELGKPDSMLRVRDALQRGEFVGILADRVIEGEGTSACEFLGEAAKFPTGPLRMAFMLKVPVMLMVGVYRGGNRYDVHFEQLVDMGAVDARQRDAVLDQALRDYVGRIEYYCRRAPYNWFNFFDFWR